MCYADLDGDGYRTSEVIESEDLDCSDAGEASTDIPLIDCDDTRAGVYPGAEEIIGDGVDQDCNGTDPVAEDEADTEDTGDSEPSGGGATDDDGGATDDDGGATDDDGGATDDDEDETETPIEVTVEMDAPTATPEKSGCSTVGQTPPQTLWFIGVLGLLGLRRRESSFSA